MMFEERLFKKKMHYLWVNNCSSFVGNADYDEHSIEMSKCFAHPKSFDYCPTFIKGR